MDIVFHKTEKTHIVNNLRVKYYQSLTAPIDAMWELLYIASSQYYLIKKDDTILGYCCINEKDCLIQIYLEKEHCSKMNAVFEKLIESELITSASLSTNEAIGFNACLLLSKSNKANTYCYEHSGIPMSVTSNFKIELVTSVSIPAIKAFLKDQVGMDDTFGYTENLVSRKEIYMVKESDQVIATSEYRRSDTQPNIVDLGIIVNKNHQGRGLATHIMQMQVKKALINNKKPICSTTVDNIASQKAIEKAGFYRSNIIFDFIF